MLGQDNKEQQNQEQYAENEDRSIANDTLEEREIREVPSPAPTASQTFPQWLVSLSDSISSLFSNTSSYAATSSPPVSPVSSSNLSPDSLVTASSPSSSNMSPTATSNSLSSASSSTDTKPMPSEMELLDFADAIRTGDLITVNEYIAKGYDLNHYLLNKWLPLAYAVKHERGAIVRTMLKAGAQHNALAYKDEKYDSKLIAMEINSNICCIDGGCLELLYTHAVILELRKIDSDAVKTAINRPAYLSVTSTKVRTSKADYRLFNNELSVRQQRNNMAVHSEMKPLLLAARHGLLDDVVWLIEQGANLHAVDKYCGHNPLHWAVREGHLDVVNVLVGKGLSVDDKALELARVEHNTVMKQYLLQLRTTSESDATSSHGLTNF